MSHVTSTLGQDQRQLLEKGERLQFDVTLSTVLYWKKSLKQMLFSVNLYLEVESHGLISFSELVW